MTELKVIRALLNLLTASERRSLSLLALLLVLAGGLEILGLGTIYLFTGILNELSTQSVVDFRVGWFDPQLDRWSIERFAVVGGIVLIGIFAIKAGFILSVQILVMRFVFGVYQRFSTKLFAGYLRASLLYHIQHGTAEAQRNLNIQVGAIFNSAAVSLVYVISNVIAMICLFSVLCLIDPVASMLALGLLGVVGFIYYSFVRNRLLSLGRRRPAHISAAIRCVGHAIVGIREVRLLGAEEYFERGFQEQVRAVARADRNIRIVSQVPGILNEGAMIVGVVGLMLLYLHSGRSIPELLPILATFGLAGMRMMGMAASTVTHVQQLQFHGPAIQEMKQVIDRLQAHAKPEPTTVAEDLNFTRSVALKNISFRYPQVSLAILDNVTLEIPKRSRTALLGPSGSGKTTLLSILLGLLEPSSGAVLADGVPIRANLRSWFAKLAYVPQSIFILDDTVRANVLFGREPLTLQNDEEIWAALEDAQIAGLVRELPHGLDTVLGDNGAILSGGERQRIGIARALLRRPDLLVLDEATSALDRETEYKVLRRLSEHYIGMTLVIATHRTETVQDYARRYVLQDGRLVDVGAVTGAVAD